MSKASHTDPAAVQRRGSYQQSPARMPRILVAEDDAEMRRLLVWHLRNASFDMVTSCSITWAGRCYPGTPMTLI